MYIPNIRWCRAPNPWLVYVANNFKSMKIMLTISNSCRSTTRDQIYLFLILYTKEKTTNLFVFNFVYKSGEKYGDILNEVWQFYTKH